MNLDFEKILFYATVICGVVALIDVLYFAPRRKQKYPDRKKHPLIFDYARSFFPILLIVFLLRSFFYEPFIVPSGSLKPTLLTGEFILVNKYTYGVRLPILHYKLVENHEPKRGDIMVFRFPPNPKIYYIKRVIGLPGDHISYIDKVLYVNGEKVSQEYVKDTTDENAVGDTVSVVQKEENLLGIKHNIFIKPESPMEDFRDLIVPPGMYFMMGDNRDDSQDSRYWGFVPEQNIVGKAQLVWLSWNNSAPLTEKIRWNRIGTRIH